MDFEAELAKLLAQESEPLPESELVEIAAAGRQLLLTLNKKQADISMQVEELYDLTKDSDNTALQEALQDVKARAQSAVRAAVGLCDLIEDFFEYSQQSGMEELARQALMMRKEADGLLEQCGIARLGEEGQPLDPDVHSVRSGAASQIPREHVVKVLQSGYRYLGAIMRKATVVVSMGMESQDEHARESIAGDDKTAREQMDRDDEPTQESIAGDDEPTRESIAGDQGAGISEKQEITTHAEQAREKNVPGGVNIFHSSAVGTYRKARKSRWLNKRLSKLWRAVWSHND